MSTHMLCSSGVSGRKLINCVGCFIFVIGLSKRIRGRSWLLTSDLPRNLLFCFRFSFYVQTVHWLYGLPYLIWNNLPGPDE